MFRNITASRGPLQAITPGELEQALAQNPATKPAARQGITAGWETVSSHHGLVAGMGPFLVSLSIHERYLPAWAITAELNERARAYENANGHAPSRVWKGDMRAEIAMDLLAKAPIRQKSVRVLLDPENSLVLIDSTNNSEVELALDALRTAGLNASDLHSWDSGLYNVPASLTSWIATREPPHPFTLGSSATIKTTEDGEKSSIRYSNRTLGDEQMRAFITQGYQCHQLQLIWDDRAAFTLTHSGEFKSFKLLDFMQPNEGLEDDLDADIELFAKTMRAIINALACGLGSESAEARPPQKHIPPKAPPIKPPSTDNTSELAEKLQERIRQTSASSITLLWAQEQIPANQESALRAIQQLIDTSALLPLLNGEYRVTAHQEPPEEPPTRRTAAALLLLALSMLFAIGANTSSIVNPASQATAPKQPAHVPLIPS